MYVKVMFTKLFVGKIPFNFLFIRCQTLKCSANADRLTKIHTNIILIRLIYNKVYKK